MQELNSKSFEFNSKGLNKDYELEVSKNVKIFGGASKMGKELSARFGDQLEAEIAWGYFCKCVVINSKLKEYLI